VHGIETAGASFGAADVEEMLGWDRVIGLAEVMDYFGVINQTERMQGIVEAALEKNVPVSGHCLGLSGMDLSAYLVAGPASDHEANNYEELLEKLRAGMTVEGRVSSFVESMSPLGRIVQELGEAPPNLVMCTDDLFPEDIIQNGHMDHVVRKGIGAGIPPVQAVRAATYNGAQRHRLYDLGALAPGKLADILLVPDFEHFTPDEVFAGGVLVAKAGKMLVELNDSAGNPLESENTVHLPFAPQAGRFQLPAREDRSTEQVNVLVTHPDFTRTLERLTLPVKDGWVDISDYPELCWVSIIERHGGNGNHSLGVIKGTGLREGALASTVAHDCHNLTIIGRNPEDMATAAAALTECGGGVAYASSGKVQSVLPLPIGGLMSPLGLDEMMQQMEAINQTLRPAGMQSVAGIFALALPVIPDYGFTDYGLVDVRSQTVLPVLST
jgi:adenine deaminase